MTQIEITNLEYASRASFGWAPEGYDGKTHYRAVLTAALPAVGILAVAATLLASMF
jgi:hypothetical protein